MFKMPPLEYTTALGGGFQVLVAETAAFSILNPHGPYVAHVYPQEQGRERAAFIVNACNNHENFVRLLKEAAGIIHTRWPGTQTLLTGAFVQEILDALAAAGEPVEETWKMADPPAQNPTVTYANYDALVGALKEADLHLDCLATYMGEPRAARSIQQNIRKVLTQVGHPPSTPQQEPLPDWLMNGQASPL